MASSRSRSDGPLRLTKVGLWFLAFALVVAAAAANTGNNGLFLVLSAMVGTLLVSGVLAGRNVRGLEVALAARGEVFANRPARLDLEIRSRGWLPRWLLLSTVDPDEVEAPGADPVPAAYLVPYLEPGRTVCGQLELMPRRRGRRRIRRVHVSSLFPLGFFRKGRRYSAELEILVYPEVLAPSPQVPEQLGQAGERAVRRAGWGHDLFGLRRFRHGDDPRGIHWKQSARTGDLVYKQREAEENRRLLIVLDNAAGFGSREDQAFERLVSEAATAALDFLEQGYEVGLATREGALPFAAGPRQRRAILETLALIEIRGAAAAPLAAPAGSPCLHLAVDAGRAAA
ncbi:MAG TPA: DUF58 domain-containing protein [Thermoanaerobaculia bacterium]